MLFRLAEIGGITRFAFGLRGFLRERLNLATAERLLVDGMATREQRFLHKLRVAVFGNPTSPYLALCRHAGCELGDLERQVARDGVEPTLAVMREAGIRVDWEELRGRTAAIRGSARFEFHWNDFDNPFVQPELESSTGGSSGRPVRVQLDLEDLAWAAPAWTAMIAAHGLLGAPMIFWIPNHVGAAARRLFCSKFGMDFEKWFVMARVVGPDDRIRSTVVHGLTRLIAGYPAAEDAPLHEPRRVLDHLLGRAAEGTTPVVNTSPSGAAMLADTALERGATLENIHFLLGAEPVTLARWEKIRSAGASAISTYGTSECGFIGAQFPGEAEPDGVHVFREAWALLPGGRKAEGPEGGEILFTCLRPAAPKVLINAGIGDSAVLENGCPGPPAERYGYDVRMHTIRSFGKVTVWGSTLAVTDLVDIIETQLPSRFGGALADYQLVEEQDADGRPRLDLRIAPAVGPLDEAAVQEAFLQAVARRRSGYRRMAEEIRSTGTLKVVRQTPVLTSRGKVLPVAPRRRA